MRSGVREFAFPRLCKLCLQRKTETQMPCATEIHIDLGSLDAVWQTSLILRG